MLLQQGDVLLERIKELPEGVKKKKGFVLAEGEVTGHAHKIDLTKIKSDLVSLYEKDGILYVKANADVPLIHEEHGTVEIKKGIYKVRKVQEYDHFLEESREVRD